MAGSQSSQDWQSMLSQEQREALARVRNALFVPAEERSEFERGASTPQLSSVNSQEI